MMKIKPKKYKPTEILIMDQTNKQRCFIQSRDLHFQKRNGIRIAKLHTVYKFKQSPWLAEYIKNKTKRRSRAKTDF